MLLISCSYSLDILIRKWEHLNRIDRHSTASCRYQMRRMGFLQARYALKKRRRSHGRKLTQRQRLLVVGQMVLDACVGGPPLWVNGLDCWPWFTSCAADCRWHWFMLHGAWHVDVERVFLGFLAYGSQLSFSHLTFSAVARRPSNAVMHGKHATSNENNIDCKANII